jgi:hypothetical protein
MHSVTLKDGGKTNCALKFNREDGILKYFNDMGDLICAVQAEPDVILSVELISNRGIPILNEISLGKRKKHAGNVLQIVPNWLRCDQFGKCEFRCHIHTTCQNCKCLFFLIKVSWTPSYKISNDDDKENNPNCSLVDKNFKSLCVAATSCGPAGNHSIVSSPFVGSTKESKCKVPECNNGKMICWFNSMLTFELFIETNSLYTGFIFPAMVNHPLLSLNAKILKCVSHRVSHNPEVITSQFMLYDGNILLEDASYTSSKARSQSHLLSDDLNETLRVNDAHLQDRSRVFVGKLLALQNRGSICECDR